MKDFISPNFFFFIFFCLIFLFSVCQTKTQDKMDDNGWTQVKNNKKKKGERERERERESEREKEKKEIPTSSYRYLPEELAEEARRNPKKKDLLDLCRHYKKQGSMRIFIKDLLSIIIDNYKLFIYAG